MNFLKNMRKTAKLMDRQDPLKKYKKLFALPKKKTYLCNNSLGLPLKKTQSKLHQLVEEWKTFGASGWFEKNTNWYSAFDDSMKKSLASLLGAKNEEVCVMNSLTVNLHLLLVSFYRPTKEKYKIIIDAPTFPSDLYAIKSHLHFHGFNPEADLIVIAPKKDQLMVCEEDIVKAFEESGDKIALGFFSSVNFLTGHVLDMAYISRHAKKKGIVLGCDMAHAAGNICLDLHNQNIDFAVGCSYKYLCSGPGGPGLAFVHEKHHKNNYPRMSGWWGNDPAKRFNMHLEQDFLPFGGASSWQVSTPSLLSLIPLSNALEVFYRVGIEEIRKKSKLQVEFLLKAINYPKQTSFEIVTPHNPEKRGAQVSIKIKKGAREVVEKLNSKGIICDFRPPNIIRVTPSPLYTTFREILEFSEIFLKSFLSK